MTNSFGSDQVYITGFGSKMNGNITIGITTITMAAIMTITITTTTMIIMRGITVVVDTTAVEGTIMAVADITIKPLIISSLYPHRMSSSLKISSVSA